MYGPFHSFVCYKSAAKVQKLFEIRTSNACFSSSSSTKWAWIIRPCPHHGHQRWNHEEDHGVGGAKAFQWDDLRHTGPESGRSHRIANAEGDHKCDGMRPTRDILYVSGLISSGDTLHVFVVHLPSRYGGERYSRPFRQVAAECLCQSIDSIRAVSPDARLLIAGDFNDGSDSPILKQIYQHGIRNLTKDVKGQNGVRGTYRYKGEWESIDHILASRVLYNKVDTTYIHSPKFLLEDEKLYGGLRPRRTYNGMRYQPGYSDHLPLVVRIR